MKKVLSLLALLILMPVFVCAAGIRESVCIVRSNLSEKNTAFLTNYKTSLSKQGYSKYAKAVESYLTESFGSGFVYSSGGKLYVLTNRHVVSNAETVKVQFEKDDGTYDEYDKLKIVAVDEVLDLALIELPSSCKRTAFTLSTTTVDDGDEVYSAGFPGLGNEPAWQFGKGVVTNSRTRIKELVDPSVTTLIQHSAQVDGGNSGGPLLVKDASSKLGYSVVAINTWKATNRENSNFSIPVAAVKTFLSDALSSRNSEKDFAKRMDLFKASIENKDATYAEMERYVSNDMATSISSNTFLKMLNSTPSNTQSLMVDVFLSDPLQGIRCTFAYHIYSKFHKKEEVLPFKAGTPELNDGIYSVDYIINEKTVVQTKWITEQGKWRLADFDKIVETDGKNLGNGFSLSNPYLLSVDGIALMPGQNGLGYEFDFGFSISNNEGNIIAHIFYEKDDNRNACSKSMFGIGAEAGLPLNFDSFIITPYLYADLGIGGMGAADPSESGMILGYGLGLDVTMPFISSSCAPVVGVQWRNVMYNPMGWENPYTSRKLAIKAGIKFYKSTFSLW